MASIVWIDKGTDLEEVSMTQKTINPLAAYAESTELNKYYHDRNLVLADENATLRGNIAALEQEKEQLHQRLIEMQKEIEALNNGCSRD